MPRKTDTCIPAGLIDPAEVAFAATVVLERLRTMAGEAGGVKDGSDIEFVHRMRVASRRLRTALRVFADCLPARPLKVWLRMVRRITRSLSRARDLDVQLEFVARFNTPRLKPRFRLGIGRLELRLRQQRAGQQTEVAKRVERFEASRVVESIEDRLGPLAANAPASNALWRRVGREVGSRLDEVLGYCNYIDRPGCVAELHEMRIATKHLRYSLELFQPLFDNRLDSIIEKTKELQTLLGDLHDADVWIEFLPGFARTERQRAIDYSGSDRGIPRLVPGLEYLKNRVTALRRKHYREFARAWHQSEADQVWERLAQTTGSQAASRPTPDAGSVQRTAADAEDV